MAVNAIFGFGAIFFVSIASFFGAITLISRKNLLPEIYNILIAFATGVLIGTAFYHLFPEAVKISGGFTNQIATLTIIGLLIPFILEKSVHWHHHHTLEHKDYVEEIEESGLKPLVVVNLTGDAVHNFIDGAVIIGAFSINISIGWITFVGIFVHELAQELGDFTILIEGGLEIKKALLWNFISALTAFLGGLIAFFINVDVLKQSILPIAAGNLLYLAIADIIPELHQKIHRKDWIIQIGIGGIGVILMYLITFLGV